MMCRKKKEEKDLPVLYIALMYPLKVSMSTLKEQIKITYR